MIDLQKKKKYKTIFSYYLQINLNCIFIFLNSSVYKSINAKKIVNTAQNAFSYVFIKKNRFFSKYSGFRISISCKNGNVLSVYYIYSKNNEDKNMFIFIIKVPNILLII